MCGAPFTKQKLALENAGHCTAPLTLAWPIRHMYRNAETAAACRRILWAPSERPAPLGLALHPAQGACTCGAPLNPPQTGLAQGRPLAQHFWHLQGASATCTAKQRLLLHVGGCSGPKEPRPAPFGLALHPAQGACTCGAAFTHQKLVLNKAGHLYCTFGTCRACQPPAAQIRDCWCMSADALGPQGPGLHP